MQRRAQLDYLPAALGVGARRQPLRQGNSLDRCWPAAFRSPATRSYSPKWQSSSARVQGVLHFAEYELAAARLSMRLSHPAEHVVQPPKTGQDLALAAAVAGFAGEHQGALELLQRLVQTALQLGQVAHIAVNVGFETQVAGVERDLESSLQIRNSLVQPALAHVEHAEIAKDMAFDAALAGFTGYRPRVGEVASRVVVQAQPRCRMPRLQSTCASKVRLPFSRLNASA